MSDRPYQSRLLVAPCLGEAGVEHRCDGEPALLAWSRVEAARAAEVGEPQGVRTVVFDLIVSEPAGLVALRLDAEPGEDAQRMARAVADAVGDRALPSLKSLAGDGVPTRWYPDLEGFEEAGPEELRLGS